MTKETKLYPCPCCGFRVFASSPGSFDICPICYWEDDLLQLRFPHSTGANKLPLIQAQKNYQNFGASDERLRGYVRIPAPDEEKDPQWRIIDESFDEFESLGQTKDVANSYPTDLTKLYYWTKE